jgi:hypothetical protein
MFVTMCVVERTALIRASLAIRLIGVIHEKFPRHVGANDLTPLRQEAPEPLSGVAPICAELVPQFRLPIKGVA